MKAVTVREKLYDYIRFADDKKVKAIYTIVEDDIAVKDNPWDEKSFVKELERRAGEYEKGAETGVTWEEVKAKTIKP